MCVSGTKKENVLWLMWNMSLNPALHIYGSLPLLLFVLLVHHLCNTNNNFLNDNGIIFLPPIGKHWT